MTTYQGVYRIKNVETGTFMTMTATGAKTSIVCSEAEAGDKKALWRLVVVRDGKYKLRNIEHNLEAHTGQDFFMIGEPNGHSWFIRNGTGDERIIDSGNHNVILEVAKTKKVQLKVDKSAKNQRWIIEPAIDPYPIAPGTYIIKNVKTGTVMALDHGATAEGARIFGFEANGGDNQKWDIQPGGSAPNMTIRSKVAGTYAAYPKLEQDARMRSGFKRQEYIITPADKGFHIAPVEKPDHVVDLSGAGAANETEILLWVKHGQDHQKWTFEAV